MTTSRRRTLAAGAAFAAASAGLPGSARAQAKQVVVGTWGGDYGELLRQNIDAPLMQPQGIEVLQDVANADPRKNQDAGGAAGPPRNLRRVLPF